MTKEADGLKQYAIDRIKSRPFIFSPVAEVSGEVILTISHFVN